MLIHFAFHQKHWQLIVHHHIVFFIFHNLHWQVNSYYLILNNFGSYTYWTELQRQLKNLHELVILWYNIITVIKWPVAYTMASNTKSNMDFNFFEPVFLKSTKISNINWLVRKRAFLILKLGLRFWSAKYIIELSELTSNIGNDKVVYSKQVVLNNFMEI